MGCGPGFIGRLKQLFWRVITIVARFLGTRDLIVCPAKTIVATKGANLEATFLGWVSEWHTLPTKWTTISLFPKLESAQMLGVGKSGETACPWALDFQKAVFSLGKRLNFLVYVLCQIF
jgi:hypothetical protein